MAEIEAFANQEDLYDYDDELPWEDEEYRDSQETWQTYGPHFYEVEPDFYRDMDSFYEGLED